MNARHLVVALACLTIAATADAQWAVTVKPTLDPLPAGFCAAVHLTVTDPVLKDIPRNPQGYRVTMADFDMAVTSPNGTAVGQQIDASHWNACSCQGASAGTVATVTATYPAQGLPASARVPGVSVQQTVTFTVAPPKGTLNPIGCQAAGVAIASNTPPSGSPPASSPPASSPPATTPGGTAPAASAPPAAAPPTSTPGASGPGTQLAGGGTKGASVPPTGAAPAPVPVASGGGKTPGAVVPAITPVNPSGFTAVEIAPGHVKLSWHDVPGVNYYGLFGPGVVSGGQQFFAGTTTFTATGVPAGMQQWSVGSYYMPGQVSTGVGTFPTVSLTVTAPPPPPPAALAGKYLVTMTGMRAYQASLDDFLSRDGMGDEVYAAAYVRRYDRATGTIAHFTSQRTITYGDVNKFGMSRVQAGSRSGTGGIQDADMVPTGPLLAFRTTPAQSATFPWKLWEGTLTDGADALIITPSIWEEDGSNSLYSLWEQEQQALNISMYAVPSVQNQISQKQFGVLVSGNAGMGGGTFAGTQLKIAADMLLMAFGPPVINLLASSNDRPIGLLANGAHQAMLPVHAIVLTREIIEAALAAPPLGAIPNPVIALNSLLGQALLGGAANAPGIIAPKSGTLVVTFQDSGMPGLPLVERPALYQMFIQVERVP